MTRKERIFVLLVINEEKKIKNLKPSNAKIFLNPL